MDAQLKAEISEEEQRQEEEIKPEKEKNFEEQKEASDMAKEEVKSTKLRERHSFLTEDFSQFQEEALSSLYDQYDEFSEELPSLD